MAGSNYWLDLFTPETWEEIEKDGYRVSGFRESRWKTCQRIKPGDFLICYLTKVSRFVGLLEITSESFKDTKRIWKSDIFPCRFNIKPVITLKAEFGIPVKELSSKLSYFQNLKSKNAWTGHFRGSPTTEKEKDAQVIIKAIQDAEKNPKYRTIQEQVKRRRKGRKRKIKSPHNKFQWILLKLGKELNLDVWVARNDRNKSYKKNRFSDITIKNLPTQFDPLTNSIIEHIDVLWLDGNAIQSAFEIEVTTSIYSGILRMADLLTLQPNLDIRLYILAPDNRREKVFEEIQRPTFQRLRRPLPKVCKYISFTTLEEEIERLGDMVKHLKPDFIESIAEKLEVK